MSSLVIQTSFLGDMVLTTPLIAELARQGPVDVVATPVSAGLLANNPDVRQVIVYDKRGTARGIRGFKHTAGALRDCGASTAYLAQGSLRSATLAFAAGVPSRVGFSTSAGRALYSRVVRFHKELHHAARLWQLANPDVMPSTEQMRPRLYPGDAEHTAVDALLRNTGIAPGAPIVALAPGSVWGTKRWPQYPELARALASDVHVIVIGSRDDRALADAIRVAAGSSVVDATGALSLLASADLVGRCRVLVTNDSAPQHLASAMGTPTVAIFGPTIPGFGFGPLAAHSVIVEHPTLDCRPCDKHGPPVCPLGHWRCMRELASDDVATRVRHLLSTATH